MGKLGRPMVSKVIPNVGFSECKPAAVDRVPIVSKPAAAQYQTHKGRTLFPGCVVFWSEGFEGKDTRNVQPLQCNPQSTTLHKGGGTLFGFMLIGRGEHQYADSLRGPHVGAEIPGDVDTPNLPGKRCHGIAFLRRRSRAPRKGIF